MPDGMNSQCFSLPTRNTQEKADRRLEAKLATQLQQLPLPCILLSRLPLWISPRIFRSGLSSCCLCQSSELALLCSREGSVSALPALPVKSFLFVFGQIYQAILTLAGVFFWSLTEFYWTAPVNFLSNNGRVEFPNLVLPEVSLKPSLLLSSNLSMF